MDSVGKTSGTGRSRWYMPDVEYILRADADLKVENDIGAGFQRLSELTAASQEWVQGADVV